MDMSSWRFCHLPQLLLLFLVQLLHLVQSMEPVMGPIADAALEAYAVHIQASKGLPPDQRARALLDRMTDSEKVEMVHGPHGGARRCNTSATCAYSGNVAALPRLGIPPLNMNDGPQGFKEIRAEEAATSTAFPSGLSMAATWDPAAAQSWGSHQGREFREKGANVQLGPGMNLARVPRNGRNFEYGGGEDPFLGYVMAKAAVSGIQSQKVIATAKHWVLNSQELNRGAVSEDASERVKFELYYPPFEGAIEAGVGAMMCSYNKIDGKWSCENPETLNRDLRDRLGFKGFVMSDWGATHSASIDKGLDMEMPGDKYMKDTAGRLEADWDMEADRDQSRKTLPRNMVNQSVERILRSMFAVGIMDEPPETWDWTKLKKNVTSPESAAEVRRLGAMSMILLKNANGILPLPAGKRIALIGFAGDNAITHCEGSGSVTPSHVVTPLEGITKAAGEGANVTFTDGCDTEQSKRLARAADYAIVFVGTRAGEGHDRPSLSLDTGCIGCKGNVDKQNQMVHDVLHANPNTIVVATVPGAVLLPWSQEVPGILMSFMPGQEVGASIADVLFGAVNPTAKLPLTIPNSENEIEFDIDQYPGRPPNRPRSVQYKEELCVGYRFYESLGIPFVIGFPFGHGLSYTQFQYRDLSIVAAETGSVSMTLHVKNIGAVPGAEVAQLYLTFPGSGDIGEPPRQLKGFHKTGLLQPGADEVVTIELRPRDRSIWDEVNHRWQEVKGNFVAEVGASSRDIRLSLRFST